MRRGSEVVGGGGWRKKVYRSERTGGKSNRPYNRMSEKKGGFCDGKSVRGTDPLGGAQGKPNVSIEANHPKGGRGKDALKEGTRAGVK